MPQANPSLTKQFPLPRIRAMAKRKRQQEGLPPWYPPHCIKEDAQQSAAAPREGGEDNSQILLGDDDKLHVHELQLSYRSAFLPQLQEYCRRKDAFRRGGLLQGRLVLRVPRRTADENRALWKRLGNHSLHTSHPRGAAHFRFFEELSVECAEEGGQTQLTEDGGTCRLLLPMASFEAFFAFLCRYAEGYWAYRFEASEELWISTNIIDPTPEQWELWNEDI